MKVNVLFFLHSLCCFLCLPHGTVKHISISIHMQHRGKMKSDPDLCVTVAPVALLAQPAD